MRELINSYYIPRYVFSKIPTFLKRDYGDYFKTIRRIKETENLASIALQDYQYNSLKNLIDYSWKNIEGYKLLWKKHGFHPDKFKTINDLRLIPYITKEILRRDIDKFTNRLLPNLRKISTGGSVGIPLIFYQQRKNIFIEKAFIHDIWSKKYPQITPKTKSTILRGRDIDGIYAIDPMHGLILSAFEITPQNVEIFIRQIEKYKSPLLQAYPSALYVMANIMQDYNFKIDHKFDCLMFGSEPLYDFQRDLIKEVFNTKICHWYGLGEKTVLAGNCEYSDKFHIYPQYGMAEILDSNGNQVNEGQVGEIVGTGFWNYTTPFIRYKSMDFAELGASGCHECGRDYQLLNKIEGRLQEFIVSKNHKLIALTGVSIICGKFKGIKQFRFHQEKTGEVVFKYIKKDNTQTVNESLIHDSLKSKLGEDYEITVQSVDSIDRTKQGKLKYLDQKLDVSQFI